MENEQKDGGSKKMKLTIGWLYPRQMSTYGDRGNILTIHQRCRWRGIDVIVKEIGMKERVDPLACDLYFFGGGQDQAQIKVSQDLLHHKKQGLSKAARLGAVFLGICGGYQLLGHYYKPASGNELKGLDLLDVVTVAGGNRMIGNIVIEKNRSLPIEGDKLLVGFENHSGRTYIGKKASPLGFVVAGYGNNGEDRTEGAFQNNVFGCYLHGPILPKNSKFADFLIQKSLERKHGRLELKPLEDSTETAAHRAAIERAKKER